MTSFQMDVSTSSSGDSPIDSSQISLKSTAIKHASSFLMLGKAVIVIVVIGSSTAAWSSSTLPPTHRSILVRKPRLGQDLRAHVGKCFLDFMLSTSAGGESWKSTD